MTRPRKQPSLTLKLAAALLQMTRHRLSDDGGCVTEPIIPHQEAKTLTAEQIIARFRFDHYPIPHAEDGPDEPWNIQPIPTAEHAIKTATIDVPGIAKRKRVVIAEAEFHERMATPRAERPAKKSRFPKGRKLQGGSSFKRRNT